MKKIMILIVVAFLLFACFEGGDQIPGEQNVTFQLMKSADIDVASAVCVVSAEDMDTLVVTLTVTPTSVSGEIEDVPYGEDRLFEIKTYNSSGLMNYYGSTLIDINSIAPTVNITLYPVNLTADVSIVGTFAGDEETEEKIAFVADYTGNYEVYIMDTDGTNIKKLTSSEYNANCPCISPDREKVVYQRPSEVGHQAFIVDVNTLEEIMLPLVEYSPHTLSWSPDGEKLLFTSWIYGYSDLFEYDIELDSVTCIIEDSSRIWGPRYTTDGEHVLFHSDASGTFRGYIANLDGSGMEMLSAAEGAEERTISQHPSDQDKFLFAGRGYSSTSHGQWGLFVLNRQSQEVGNIISTNHVDEKGPAWNQDGEKVIYERWDGNSHGIYVINVDGTNNTALLDTDGNERYPHWR